MRKTSRFPHFDSQAGNNPDERERRLSCVKRCHLAVALAQTARAEQGPLLVVEREQPTAVLDQHAERAGGMHGANRCGRQSEQ